MTAPTLPAAITEAISAIRCDARFGDTIRGLESTLAPWLAIVREVARRTPIDARGYECVYCGAEVKRLGDASSVMHFDECPWLRATQLVAASHRT